MLKKLIIIENGKEVQCDSLEELVKILIYENYYDLSDKEKNEKIKIKALANTLNTPMEIVNKISDNNIKNKFIIKDEITYILSWLSINKIILLERKDANILTKSINKENMSDNYIIVNKFAKDLLEKYITNNTYL